MPIIRLVTTSRPDSMAMMSAHDIPGVGPWVPIKLITCGTACAAGPMSVLYAVKYVTALVVAANVMAFDCSMRLITF